MWPKFAAARRLIRPVAVRIDAAHRIADAAYRIAAAVGGRGRLSACS